jgi:XapX domain-containing protein
MKPYLVTLALGLLVGAIYGLFQVRSPAPPVIALVGLLGILLGEQIPPLVRQFAASEAPAVVWLRHQVHPHMFGSLPCGSNTLGTGKGAPSDAGTPVPPTRST